MMQQQQKLRLIMVVCLILSTFSSLYSQAIDSKQYNYIGNWYNWQGGRFINNLNIPKVTATTGRDTGAVRYALADSSVYVWTGSQWRQVAGGSGADSSVFATRYYTQQTFVPYTGATGSVNLGVWGLTADRLVFNQAPTLAGGVGTIRWNDTDGTLEFGMKGGNVTQQVGQELPVRMRNNTGSTILNGEAVYISGSTGSSTIIAKAKADASSTSKATIGLLTEDIANGQSGFVTVFGKVRDINTSALTEGELVYLSSTVAGGLTSTPPTGDTYTVVIGVCERSHAVNGVIFVHIDKEYTRKYDVDTALANRLQNITGLVTQGTNVTITGSGTSGSPYVVNATGGASGLNTVMGIDSNTTHRFSSNQTIYTADSLYSRMVRSNQSVIVGDTITTQADTTYFWGVSVESGSNASPSTLRYSTIASTKLNTVEVNKGIGSTTMSLVSAGDSSFTDRLYSVPNYRSTIRYIVIGMYAINDCNLSVGVDNYSAYFSAAMDTLLLNRLYPASRIIVMTPSLSYLTSSGKNEDSLRLYVNATIAIAKAKGLIIVDVFNSMLATGGRGAYISSDSLHPNNAGHNLTANELDYATGTVKANGSLIVTRNATIRSKLTVGSDDFIDGDAAVTGAFKVKQNDGFIAFKNSAGNSILQISGGTASNYLRLLTQTSGASFVSTVGNNALSFQTNSVTRYAVTGAGAHTITATQLDITNTGTTNGTLTGAFTMTSSASAGQQYFFLGNSTSTLFRANFGNNTSKRLYLSQNSNSPEFAGGQNGDINIKANSTDSTARLFIGAGGSAITKASIIIQPRNHNVVIGDQASDTLQIPSAQLAVNSTIRGFLPPRMTGAQAEAISSPAEGLMVYATDGSGSTITSKGWWGYDGSAWVKLNYLLFGLCFVRRKNNYFKRT